MLKLCSKLLAICGLGALILGSAGCVAAPVVPPTGLVYTNFDAPLSLGGGGRETGVRKGEASVTSILGLFSWGDGSVKAAARDGSIDKVMHVDYAFTNIIGIYQRYTTVVYGE